MEEKIGFLETWNAKAGRIEKSNTRKMADIIIIGALLFCFMIVSTACYEAIWGEGSLDGLLTVAGSVGGIFVSVAGSAMLFLFNQKKEENKPGS